MKKYTGPNLTAISKAIAKVKTIKQLDKVQMLVVDYRGKYSRAKKLYSQYNAKNRKIRFPKPR